MGDLKEPMGCGSSSIKIMMELLSAILIKI
jgi:hypothetical protein